MDAQIDPPVSRPNVHGTQADNSDIVTMSPAKQRSSVGLEIVELELALDANDVARHGFVDTVSAAARAIGGDYLFSLPAAGLANGYQKIAVVRLSGGGKDSLVFVLLDENGTRLEVQLPDDATSALARFSAAFVEVLERL